MTINTVENNASVFMEYFVDGMTGKSRAISRSNIRNSMAIRKNRKEKGRRADFIGSNPHSYGVFFSSSRVRLGRKWPTISNARDREVAIRINVIRFMSLIDIKEKWQIVYAADLKSSDRGLIPLFSYDPHQ